MEVTPPAAGNAHHDLFVVCGVVDEIPVRRGTEEHIAFRDLVAQEAGEYARLLDRDEVKPVPLRLRRRRGEGVSAGDSAPSHIGGDGDVIPRPRGRKAQGALPVRFQSEGLHSGEMLRDARDSHELFAGLRTLFKALSHHGNHSMARTSLL